MLLPKLFTLLLLAASPNNSDSLEPFEGWHYLGGGASATVGSAAGGIAGAFIGAAISDSDGWDSIGTTLLGGFLGIIPGAIGGLMSYTSLTKTEGSDGWAWAGASIGLISGIGILSQSPNYSLSALFLSPAVGAALGYGLGYSESEISLGVGEVEGTRALMFMTHF